MFLALQTANYQMVHTSNYEPADQGQLGGVKRSKNRESNTRRKGMIDNFTQDFEKMDLYWENHRKDLI